MDLLCHAWLTRTNLSYRFPMFETSATALCSSSWYLVLWLARDTSCYIMAIKHTCTVPPSAVPPNKTLSRNATVTDSYGVKSEAWWMLWGPSITNVKQQHLSHDIHGLGRCVQRKHGLGSNNRVNHQSWQKTGVHPWPGTHAIHLTWHHMILQTHPSARLSWQLSVGLLWHDWRPFAQVEIGEKLELSNRSDRALRV